MKNIHKFADQMIQKAIKAVDPFQLIKNQIQLENNKLIISGEEAFDLNKINRIKLIGFGKGVAPMAAAMEEIMAKRIEKGRIVVKYGHAMNLKKTDVFEAAHPIPDANTLAATANILKFIDDLTADDLVIVVISGGGSALFELLPDYITLSDLEELSRLLLSSGATIGEINIIRKHISLVKGGRLAQRIAPAKCLSLILSDVIGDPLTSIASGPTAPDNSTFNDALHTIKQYNLTEKVPPSIIKHLDAGEKGKIIDTPKPGEVLFKSIHNHIIGNNRLALEEAKKIAAKTGYQTHLLTDQMEGEAREIAKLLAAMIKSALQSGIPVSSPGCILLGGEPTVTLSGNGKGGRNQELVLAVLLAMQDIDQPFYFCSVGTDGTDGPTDAAGAWIDHKSFNKANQLNLKPEVYLKNNDAYHFFDQINQLIKTGPTRTNVMDIAYFIV